MVRIRVLNAVKLREEYHAQKKRRAEEEAQAGKAANKVRACLYSLHSQSSAQTDSRVRPNFAARSACFDALAARIAVFLQPSSRAGDA